MIKRDYFISARIYEDNDASYFFHTNYTVQYKSFISQPDFIYSEQLEDLKKKHGKFKKIEIVSFNRI
tara:strand:- start:362 stop:562 length:201 start_codon:yes stop_codon:yes gene_type:complete